MTRFLLTILAAVLFAISPVGVMAESGPGAAEIRWFELVSEDASAANAFYRQLFGWEIRPTATGAYVAMLNGKEIAGISQLDEPDNETQESQWIPAFMVRELSAMVDRARKAGAEILDEITFVDGYGRYAVIRDPQGAILMLSDATRVPDADQSQGNWIWGELWTTNPEASAYFYNDMADMIAMHEETVGDDAYNVFVVNGKNIAGFMPVADPEFATRWGGYIAVDDVDHTVRMAKELGGEVFDVNVDQHGDGKVAVLADPAGAVFFIYELDKEKTGEEK